MTKDCGRSARVSINPIALTIAGFDPSGGAGVLADIRTFEAFGLSAVAAITSITFQDSDRVHGAKHETAESLRSQFAPLVEQFANRVRENRNVADARDRYRSCSPFSRNRFTCAGS